MNLSVIHLEGLLRLLLFQAAKNPVSDLSPYRNPYRAAAFCLPLAARLISQIPGLNFLGFGLLRFQAADFDPVIPLPEKGKPVSFLQRLPPKIHR